MARNVPVGLQAELDSGCTTLCDLLKIVPASPNFPTFGITSLDQDVVYDDGEGDGEIVYLSRMGMALSNLSSSSDMAVDNSQAEHLIPIFDIPVSNADIAAGALDFAEYSRYRLNYENLTAARHIVIDFGQCGEMRIKVGDTFVNEMTSLAKLLLQSIVEKDSITCRATFGSQYPGTPGAEIVEQFPCGKEFTWVAFTVTAQGFESSQTFTAAALPGADTAYEPGMVKWSTGANAGRQSEVETFAAGGIVSLTFPAMFPIQAGDTGLIRTDCTKWVEGARGCKDHWGDPEWKLHYRGEPWIPIADGDAINTPGATVGAGMGG